jgi:hypothetical protein
MRKALFFGILLAASASPAVAQTCTGNCGTASPNGVVTAPPGGTNYQYVSTNGGVSGAGQISSVGGTNGSEYVTASFTAAGGDALNFNFNYVTSDGSGYADYAFAELLLGGSHSAWLFTARTQPSGDTSPGFGLPANDSTLTPASTAIIGGGPAWDQLGGYSGSCYDVGCGYTGWINSLYSIIAPGSYQLRFGVTNWDDTAFDSGLAFSGLKLNDVPIDSAVPEPGTWAMMLLGFGAIGVAFRRRRTGTAVSPLKA